MPEGKTFQLNLKVSKKISPGSEILVFKLDIRCNRCNQSLNFVQDNEKRVQRVRETRGKKEISRGELAVVVVVVVGRVGR